MIGHVHRINHLESELCYIGSSCNELRKRWQSHKCDYQRWLEGKHSELSIYKYFKQYGIDKLILVKTYDVADRKCLQAYEQLYINTFRKTCINKYNPFYIRKLSQKDYREANKQKMYAKQ